MKISRTLLGWLIIIQLCCLHAQSHRSKIEVTRITDQIYKLFLNDVDLVYVNLIAYLSDEGILLIDAGLEDSAPEVQKVLKGLGGGKIRYIINTHSDGDHTLGNPLLGKDAIIIAHESCREEMKRDERYPDEWLPILTMKDELTIHFGNEVIHLVAMPCHTEGDIIVHFQKANILCVGDIIFSNSFPTIHPEKNGNLDKLIQVFQDLQRMFPPETRVIVGHGEDMTIGDIAEYQKMTTETIAAVRKAMQKKISTEQLKNNEILKAWRSWESPLFEELDCDLWIQNIFDFYEKKYGTNPEEFSALKGPYLGQKAPGITPELFAPGIITTEFHEHSSPAFSSDGNEVYWSVFLNFWGPQVILYMEQKDGVWTHPEVASFSGQYTDGNPCFSKDGSKLYFESVRPVTKNGEYTHELNLWVVDRTETGWGEPKLLGNGIYTDKWERGPSLSDNGNLYFCSMRGSGCGEMDIYRSTLIDGEYAEPENLGEVINTSGYESWPFIAPDESYLIFESDDRDLMISFRNEDASWSEPKNLSERMNFSGGQDRFPLLSNDGQYLFFVSSRWLGPRYFYKPLTLEEVKAKARSLSNGLGNVYWVDAKVIEELKPDYLK